MNLSDYLSIDFKISTIDKIGSNKIKGIYNTNLQIRDIILYEVRVGKINVSKISMLIETFPDKINEFNWFEISKSPNISIEYILKNINKFQWVISAIVQRDDYKLEYNVSLDNLTLTKYITFEDVLDDLNNERKYWWDWGSISASKYLDLNYVKEYQTFPQSILIDENGDEIIVDNKFNLKGLSSNPNLDEEFLQYLIDTDNPELNLDNNGFAYVMEAIISNTNISINFLEENIDIFELENILNYSSNITEEFLSKYKDTIINRQLNYGLNINPYISFNFILNNRELGWSWADISESEFVTLDNIRNYPDLPWSIYEISKNPNITEDYIFKVLDSNKRMKLQLHTFSLGSIMPMEFIETNNLLPWDFKKYSSIFSNPNLTIDFISKYRNPKLRKVKFPNSSKGNFNYSIISKNFAKNIEY